MCACGCLLVLGLGGALAYFVMHELWWAAVAVAIVAALVGWWGRKYFIASRQ